jgi:CDP-diglyceride synthetase
MRTLIWKIADFCHLGIVLFPVSAILRAVLIASLPSMKMVDQTNIRLRLALVGFGGMAVILQIMITWTQSYQLTEKALISVALFLFFSWLLLVYVRLMEEWVERMAEAICNRLNGLNG